MTFKCTTTLEPIDKFLQIREFHKLQMEDSALTEDYFFVMKCWTQEELQTNLTQAGFKSIKLMGGYSNSQPAGSTDRIVALASL